MIITPERAGEIRASLCEQHGATWLHHYHQAIEAEILAHCRQHGVPEESRDDPS